MGQNTINGRKKVKHCRFGEGEILYIKNDTIKVVFGGMHIKEFPYPQSIQNGTLVHIGEFFLKPQTMSIHESRNIFFCFQGNQYDNEFSGGYIFAGLNPSVPHWLRLYAVKIGDIIFHCDNQKIASISVVQREACKEKRPREHYLANDNPDGEGLMVRTKYFNLKTPIIISRYKEEIKEMQGDYKQKGYPFNKKAEGNQGYLFNLNRELANFFFNELIKRNTELLKNKEIQILLQKKKGFTKNLMKLCPTCELNWINRHEDNCAICKQSNWTQFKENYGGGKKHPAVYFQEEFTFIRGKAFYRGKQGFQAYNSKKENVGIVFMCDDRRTPAYGHCELCIYSKYQNRYGEWHRIQSHGGRISWEHLCKILNQKKSCKIFID